MRGISQDHVPGWVDKILLKNWTVLDKSKTASRLLGTNSSFSQGHSPITTLRHCDTESNNKEITKKSVSASDISAPNTPLFNVTNFKWTLSMRLQQKVRWCTTGLFLDNYREKCDQPTRKKINVAQFAPLFHCNCNDIFFSDVKGNVVTSDVHNSQHSAACHLVYFFLHWFF